MGFIRGAGFLGEQLVKMGILTEDQIREALSIQKEKRRKGENKKLGQILIELGYCNEKQIGEALARKSGYKFLSMNSIEVDVTYANLITPEIARKYMVMPTGLKDGKLQVAMLNPNDIIAIDDLRILTGYEIEPIVVPDNELKTVIDQFSRNSRNLESFEEYGEEAAASQHEELENHADDKPAVLLVNQIINLAVNSGASDIHVEPQEKYLRIRFRIDGVLHEIMQQPLKLHPMVASRIKVMAGMDIAERRIPQDGRISVKSEGKLIDIRVASLPSAYGEKITMRLLNRSSRIITLEQLGFPEFQLNSYKDVIRLPYGFILITGPTGSGKSTTLYATLQVLNSIDKNIITLEDPIERRMEGLNQIQINPKAGLTFASGLRSILRSDPDIIMVGEIRDRETAQIAVESALTGHLVLSTLHTNDAPGAVTRLGEMGIEPFLTASSLVGVVAQRLARVLCPKCKVAYKLTREEILYSVPDFPLEPHEDHVTLYKPAGCLTCNKTGYKGRTGIFEFLRVTEAIQKLILSGASTNEIRETAMKEGMATLRQDGLVKVKKGITSIEELLRVVK